MTRNWLISDRQLKVEPSIAVTATDLQSTDAFLNLWLEEKVHFFTINHQPQPGAAYTRFLKEESKENSDTFSKSPGPNTKLQRAGISRYSCLRTKKRQSSAVNLHDLYVLTDSTVLMCSIHIYVCVSEQCIRSGSVHVLFHLLSLCRNLVFRFSLIHERPPQREGPRRNKNPRLLTSHKEQHTDYLFTQLEHPSARLRGNHSSDLLISDKSDLDLSCTALSPFLSSQASQQLIHCVFEFYLNPALRDARIAQVGCHGFKTNLCRDGEKKSKLSLPTASAQQGAYLCIVWTTCRNLTTGERKHEVLRDLLTEQEQREDGGGRLMCCKAQRPAA